MPLNKAEDATSVKTQPSDVSDKEYISSSSGLGLNGSLMANQTADSDSDNTSDSSMLTPPSSPLLLVVTKEKKKKLWLEEVRTFFVELVEEFLLA